MVHCKSVLALTAVAFVSLTLVLPAQAGSVAPIKVQTAYLFALPHAGGGPDGGDVNITNRSATDTVNITSVFLSGWTGGTTFQWAPFGPASLGPEASYREEWLPGSRSLLPPRSSSVSGRGH